MIEKIRRLIVDVPDFPKPGILFKDITPVFSEPRLMGDIWENFSHMFNENNIDIVVSMESRGFLFGIGVADRLKIPFVPVRKVGKLPRKTVRISYNLEYGQDTIEVHLDDIPIGSRVLVIDDVLATGGTAKAVIDLVETCGSVVVACGFLVELESLGGRAKISKDAHDLHIRSMLKY